MINAQKCLNKLVRDEETRNLEALRAKSRDQVLTEAAEREAKRRLQQEDGPLAGLGQFEQHIYKRRQLVFLKQLHQDGKDITMSRAQKKLLQIDDFIQRAIKRDYEDCGLPTDNIELESFDIKKHKHRPSHFEKDKASLTE